MCGKTIKDEIRNEYIQEQRGVALMGDRLREARLRWIEHIHCMPTTMSDVKSDIPNQLPPKLVYL